MTTSPAQDREFTSKFLDLIIREIEAIEIEADDFIRWVGEEFTPEQVFSDKVLGEWAINNGFIERTTD